MSNIEKVHIKSFLIEWAIIKGLGVLIGSLMIFIYQNFYVFKNTFNRYIKGERSLLDHFDSISTVVLEPMALFLIKVYALWILFILISFLLYNIPIYINIYIRNRGNVSPKNVTIKSKELETLPIVRSSIAMIISCYLVAKVSTLYHAYPVLEFSFENILTPSVLRIWALTEVTVIFIIVYNRLPKKSFAAFHVKVVADIDDSVLEDINHNI